MERLRQFASYLLFATVFFSCQKKAANIDSDPKAIFLEMIENSRPVVGSFSKVIPGRLPYFLSYQFHPQWLATENIPEEALRIAKFSLINQKDQSFTDQNLRGKISVAVFFFASCADYCPTILRNLKPLQETFTGHGDLQFLAHSVTPDIDTPAQLNDFAKKLGLDQKSWRLLTGPRDEVYRLARESYYADTKVPIADSAEEFIHSDSAYLIDEDRYIRGIYRATSAHSLKNLKEDIQILLKSKRTAQAQAFFKSEF